MELTYKDKIYKLLFKFYKNRNKKDYHSFKAYIKNGNVYVECRELEIYIEYYVNENKNQFCGNLMSCTNLLEQLEIDLLSIEF